MQSDYYMLKDDPRSSIFEINYSMINYVLKLMIFDSCCVLLFVMIVNCYKKKSKAS